MKLKFTLFIGIAVALIVSSFRSNAQSVTFSDFGTNSYATGYTSDFDVSILDTLQSSFSSTKQVTWSVVKLSGPSQWSFTMCDPASCYSAPAPYNYFCNATSTTPWAMMANSNGTFTFHAIIHNTVGSGSYKLTAWVDGDSVNTAVSRVLNINVTVANGISKVNAAEIKLYPIPANDILNVDLNNYLAAKRIEVYNLIGAKMGTYPVDGDSNNSIPVNNLNPGMYFVKVIDARNSILTTKTFQKR